MWGRPNSQEVGLEAAILERVRNSSLVECPCADNGSGLKPLTETVDCRFCNGRGAFGPGEGGLERAAGGRRSANAGMRGDKGREKRVRRKPKVSDGRNIRVGLVGPKPQASSHRRWRIG